MQVDWTNFVQALASPIAVMAVSLLMITNNIDPRIFSCDISTSVYARNSLMDVRQVRINKQMPPTPALPLSNVASSAVCPAHQTIDWTGTCELRFGLELSMLSTEDACKSVYRSVCDGYTVDERKVHGAPRGFTMNRAYNHAMLRRVRRVESLRVWAKGPWARLAGACTHNKRTKTDPKGVLWILQEVDNLRQLSRRSVAHMLAHAINLGVSAPFYIALRAHPQQREFMTTYIEAHLELMPDLTRANVLFPTNYDALQHTFDYNQAASFAHQLTETFHAATNRPPETLHGYVLRQQDPSLHTDLWAPAADCDQSYCRTRKWLETLLHIMTNETNRPQFLPTQYLWAFALQRVDKIVGLMEDQQKSLLHYVIAQFLQLYIAPLAKKPINSPARHLAHKLAASPPYAMLNGRNVDTTRDTDATLAWHSDCQHLASTKVWWRVDRWFEDATNSDNQRKRVEVVFAKVQQAMSRLVQMAVDASAYPTLRLFLLRKLGAIRLRFRARPLHALRSDEVSDSDTPESTILELWRLQQRQFVRFAPFADGVSNRTLDATDVSISSANAFYSATDNSLTVFPGLLNGMFYNDKVDVQQLFATLGAILGHEMAHSIDSRGVWYDERGNVQSNVPRAELARYLAAMSCIAVHFSELGLDGVKVMDESFADSLGLQAAFVAVDTQNATEQQDFMMRYNQIWCGQLPSDVGWNDRDDVHAPPRLRAEFATQSLGLAAQRAFACPLLTAETASCFALSSLNDT